MRRTKRLLICGGSGLLGFRWAVAARGGYDVTILLHERHVKLKGVSTVIGNPESMCSLSEILNQVRPDIVVNTIGLSSVDECQKNPDWARHVNCELAGNIAEACSEFGVDRFVHVSTDHLFDGHRAYSDEDRAVDPVNVYGLTKADGEKRVLSLNPKALIIRTNFYGWGPAHRNSFSDEILARLVRREPVALFTDVFYTPILIDTLVDFIQRLWERDAFGIYNVVSDERISKYEFGLLMEKSLKISSGLIIPGLSTARPDLTKRPLDMSLSNKKLKGELCCEVESYESQFLRMFSPDSLII